MGSLFGRDRVQGVGRTFPGEGPETNPYELNNRTPRLRRYGVDPKARVHNPRGNADWDPVMPPLVLGRPFRKPPEVARAEGDYPAGGRPRPGNG